MIHVAEVNWFSEEVCMHDLLTVFLLGQIIGLAATAVAAQAQAPAREIRPAAAAAASSSVITVTTEEMRWTVRGGWRPDHA